MLRVWKSLAAVGGSALVLGNAVGAPGDPRPAPAALVTDADLARCFDQQAGLVPFSGVLVLDRGGTGFLRTAGTTDPEEQLPVTRTTPFRLASVQKVLTRIAIGKLVDQGRVAFDAPVGRYLQGLPAELAAVTVDQLLHHRSGVASFTRMPPDMLDKLASASTARELLPLITAEPLEFRPGEREGYSNGGYWLLGAVIEAVTGKAYGEYLAESIYRPLGMAASGLVSGPETAVRKTRMLPGQPPLPTARAVRPPREPLGTPSGDGVSTADDMLKLGRALLSDTFLQPSTKARLFPRRAGEPWRIGQSGGNIGTNTDFAVFPESNLISVVLSNYDPPAGEAMGRVMRQAALGMGCSPIRAEDMPGPGLRLGPPPAPGGPPRVGPGSGPGPVLQPGPTPPRT
jgi:CubicO group peptidase (beta-lactamase class C family)